MSWFTCELWLICRLLALKQQEFVVLIYSVKSQRLPNLNMGWYSIAVLCILLLPPLDCSICQAPGLTQPPSEHQCAAPNALLTSTKIKSGCYYATVQNKDVYTRFVLLNHIWYKMSSGVLFKHLQNHDFGWIVH